MAVLTLIASFFSLALTLGVIWANPHRFSNWAFALVAFVQTIWLACVYRAMLAASLHGVYRELNLEIWLRANASVAAFLPSALWLLKGSIGRTPQKQESLWATAFLAASAVAAAFFCFTEYFIYRDETNSIRRGAAYYAYSSIAIAVYIIYVYKTIKKIKNHHGIHRVELQFLSLTTGGASLLTVTLNTIGNYLHLRILNNIGICSLLLGFSLTVWALLFHRVFNTREASIRLIQRGTFVLILSGGTALAWQILGKLTAEPIAIILSISTCCVVALWLDRKSKLWFEKSNERKTAPLRRAAIELSGLEVDSDILATRLESLLEQNYRTEGVHFLFDRGEAYRGGNLELFKENPGYNALLAHGWATPESLNRRKSSDDLAEIQDFMDMHALSLMICVPPNTPSPSLILTFGQRADAEPFTYPEIERLQEVADLLNNIITRSRLSNQTALQAKLEYMGIASRGLAHDLKNLITPVSSYLIHTDRFFSENSAAGEVHAAALKATRAMAAYVRENLFFTENLAPLFETVDIGKLCFDARDSCLPRATGKRVPLIFVTDNARSIVADRVLLIRMLTNLIGNAIDASAEGQRITVRAYTMPKGGAGLEVSDEGCGIPSEHLTRIFDPYFTTKDVSEKPRGIGLGLTVVQKIVLIHQGRISVCSHFGRGTTFSISLPFDQTPTGLASIHRSSAQ